MTFKSIFLISVLMMLFGCTKSKTIYILANESGDLKLGAPVMLNLNKIGEVKNFEILESGEVLIRTDLNGDIDIPINSVFKNTTLDNNPVQFIEIEKGTASALLVHKDTVELKKSLEDMFDSVINKVKGSLFDKLKDKLKRKK